MMRSFEMGDCVEIQYLSPEEYKKITDAMFKCAMKESEILDTVNDGTWSRWNYVGWSKGNEILHTKKKQINISRSFTPNKTFSVSLLVMTF